MRYGSVCSGIEAASVAWHGLGWRSSFLSEIEAFPRAVLSHHWPEAPMHGDFTTIKEGEYDPIDILVGGTPCQDFSIAGLRAGMAGDRGNLTLQFLTLARRLRPEWVVWENVPGVLSSNEGRDFGAFLGGLGELGYGWAYRTLNAQFFGVPQRRRRVFVVGHLGDWRRAAAVFFERHSLQGHSTPRRQKGEGIAPTISSRPTGGGGLGTDSDCDGGLIASALRASSSPNGHGNSSGLRGDGSDNLITIAKSLTAHPSRSDWETETFVTHALRAEGFDASEDGTGRGTPLVSVAFDLRNGAEGDVTQTLQSAGIGTERGGNPNAIPHVLGVSAVRRLTPRECERLQGFPDDYTLVPFRGKPATDGPRYKALGNSMAVPVMRWIGQRIDLVHRLPK